jgi:hypothetical protein
MEPKGIVGPMTQLPDPITPMRGSMKATGSFLAVESGAAVAEPTTRDARVKVRKREREVDMIGDKKLVLR